ncbi:MAG: hypothetical protein LCH51_01125 [Bacteroidetes bacterium]|nr:hypothetical protein [Bacteroidota bacterium]
MNQDLLNILSESNKEVDNQLLMDYLSGKLKQEEQHLVEEWLTDNPFAADAIEGLQTYGNKEDINEVVNQLNKELRQYLQNKRERREKRRWKDNPLTYLAVVLLLVLIIIAYYIVRLAARQ